MVDQKIAAAEGLQFEQDFFGWTPRHSRKQRLKILRDARRMNFLDLYSIALQSQQSMYWDHQRPSTPMATSLFHAVREHLSKKTRGKLHMYCSLGTALDYRHGIDGFFMLGSNYLYCLSFDLTRSVTRTKRRRQKANILITRDYLENRDKLNSIGRLIAHKLTYARDNKIQIQSNSIFRIHTIPQ